MFTYCPQDRKRCGASSSTAHRKRKRCDERSPTAHGKKGSDAGPSAERRRNFKNVTSSPVNN
jgi:hypothetical protein